ncbi:DNA-binding response regulator [Alicyclobacillus contaminans]|uniref:response regulator transcription factor n=1 Tax=Alicyclobacillus contaminans TaxID=392016 RepID=UPI00047AA00E|nr:response regulator transcription factor [Alicyclobacillus contaminans]GMA49816.1 DNA-binding response regulator [Alicyclobacillus contaminans]
MRVLVVEDDAHLARALTELLQKHEFEVDHTDTVFNAIDLAMTSAHDCMVVDVMLPDGDGMEFVAKLRELGIHTPILMLTARNAPEDRVHGLNAGADDYLGKPFNASEFIARIEALIRRAAGYTAIDVITLGQAALHRNSRTLSYHGQHLELSSKEFLLLECLMRHPNQVLSRDQLIYHVWGPEAELADNALDTYVYFLRKKCAQLGIKNIIKTVRGQGYMIHPNPR